MFSSLASLIFGSNSESTAATETATGHNQQGDTSTNLLTSLTPSVVGADNRAQVATKGGKNKRNNTRQQNKRKGIKTPLGLNTKQAKVLTPSNSCDDGDFDEDEWFIVEEEDLKSESSLDDSGEENNIPVEEVVKTNKSIKSVADNNLSQQRRPQHINLHSLYSGPRPQKQRNFLQKSRNNTNNRPSNGLSVTKLSPSRTVNHGYYSSKQEALANADLNHSLYVTTLISQNEEKTVTPTITFDAVTNMEGSWFVTPPPCFTSVGPINMETSPYEDLLIEHPSMSVYHNINITKEATDSFTKLDISVNDKPEEQKVKETTPEKSPQAVQPRNTSSVYRLDRESVAQLKQEALARNVQKMQIKHDRQDKCRSALKRTNKARDIQSRNHIQRRSDRQHSKYCSNANNNRKTNCY